MVARILEDFGENHKYFICIFFKFREIRQDHFSMRFKLNETLITNTIIIAHTVYSSSYALAPFDFLKIDFILIAQHKQD